MPAPPTARNPSAWPRWPSLMALTLAVLGAHLLLLGGGLPRWSAAAPVVLAPAQPMASAWITRTLATDTPAARAAAAPASQVRWIAPPTPQPAPEPSMPSTPTIASPAPHAALKTATPAAAPASDQPDESPPAAPDRPASAPAASLPVATASAAAAGEPDLEAPPTERPEDQLADTGKPKPDTSEAGNPLGPAQPPSSARLDYSVEGHAKGLNFNASGSLDWVNDGTGYSARMEIRMFLLGSRSQTSEGRLVATGLQPERFADKSRSERAAHFDRSQNRVRFSNNAPDAELLPGAQDRLSVFLQLAGLLNARPEAYPAGQTIELPVVGPSGLEVWRFQVQDLTSLDLPAGSLIARHLMREPQGPYSTRVDLWLAPSLGHLPVRIRLTQDNGDVVDQRLATLP
jgi:hypothetical protein